MYKTDLPAVHAFICAQLSNPSNVQETPKNIVAAAIETDMEVQKQLAAREKSQTNK